MAEVKNAFIKSKMNKDLDSQDYYLQVNIEMDKIYKLANQKAKT